MHPFLEALNQRPLLADGGIGTLLLSRGASSEASFEHLNLTKQELVQQVHIDYINAGSEVIETNSFSGNRFRLSSFGLEADVYKINVWAAKVARAAREIAGQPTFIAGSIGPTGKLMRPLGDTTPEEIVTAYIEQMEGLLAGGVDLFMIETMSSIEETVLAIRAARKLSKLPIVAQLSFSVEGHTLLGVTPEDAVKVFSELSETDIPEVIGINCGAGPGPVFDSFLRMTSVVKSFPKAKNVTFSCVPNAGQPSLSGGRYLFMSRPDYCASYIEPYVRAGARLVGGCCGTTPEHIKAMRKQLDKYIAQSKEVANQTLQNLPAQQASGVSISTKPDGKGAKGESVTEEKSKEEPADKSKSSLILAERLRAIKKNGNDKDFYISVELDPPKGAVTKKILQAAEMLYQSGADAINVGDSPMARVRMSSLATCQLIGQQVGVDTIIHFTTRDRNLMGIQADLLGCQGLGIRNILALTGDPPGLGNYAHATAVYDVDSIGLIKIINQLNQGKDIAGNSIGSPTSLSIGCALNPTHQDRKLEKQRCKAKLEAGAHFVMTQPIYRKSDLTDFLEDYGDISVPILVGIMPLHSSKHAEYLHNEVPGISIPDNVRNAMAKAGEEGASVGLKLAEELLEELRPLCQGTYLVPSFGRYDDMCTMVKRLKERQKKALV